MANIQINPSSLITQAVDAKLLWNWDILHCGYYRKLESPCETSNE